MLRPGVVFALLTALLALLVFFVVNLLGSFRPAPPVSSTRANRAAAGPPGVPAQPQPEHRPLPTTLDALIAELDSANAGRRAAICARLGALRDPAAASVLERLLLTDNAAAVRKAALDALIKIRPDDLVTRLMRDAYLDHADEAVRADVLRALAREADAAALVPLLARLRQARYTPRWLAIDAVGAMGVPAVVPDLARLATDPRQPRDDRIRALGHLGRFLAEPAAREAVEVCRKDADEAVATVARALR